MTSLFLLAQAAAEPSQDMPQNVFIIVIVAIGVCVPIAIVAASIKYALREREMQHTERLKAIERGFLVDEVEEERRFRKGIMRLASGMGIALPVIAVVTAAVAVANLSGPTATNMSVFLIWTGAASVGVAGVGGGAWLANAALTRLRPSARTSAHEATSYPRYEVPQPMVNR